MKGSTFLKVTGILMIVFGTLALVLAIIAIAAVSLAASLGIGSMMLTLSGILALVGAVAQMVAGILGAVNWARPEKAGVCIVWGVIVIVLCILSTILTLVSDADNFSIISLLTSFVIPVLYLIGAFQNKKQLG